MTLPFIFCQPLLVWNRIKPRHRKWERSQNWKLCYWSWNVLLKNRNVHKTLMKSLWNHPKIQSWNRFFFFLLPKSLHAILSCQRLSVCLAGIRHTALTASAFSGLKAYQSHLSWNTFAFNMALRFHEYFPMYVVAMFHSDLSAVLLRTFRSKNQGTL